jgi:tight adherence protein B
MTGGMLLAGGGVGMFIAIAIVVATLATPQPQKVRLAPVGNGGGRATRSTFGSLSDRAIAIADRRIDGTRRLSLDNVLEQAGVSMRAGELVVLVAVATVVAGLVGLLFGGLLAAVVLSGLTVFGARSAIVIMRHRRRKAFADQIDDLLQLLSGSLRAGHGMMQALEMAGRELESPAGDELRRLTTEVRLGRDLVDALDGLAGRVGSEDFEWVAQAIRIHREVGGDLTEVLDRVAETVRARGHLKRQVDALSAEGRMSGGILFALPFVTAAMLAVINPEYLGELFQSGVGLAMVALGAVLLTVGAIWLRRIVRPVF